MACIWLNTCRTRLVGMSDMQIWEALMDVGSQYIGPIRDLPIWRNDQPPSRPFGPAHDPTICRALNPSTLTDQTTTGSSALTGQNVEPAHDLPTQNRTPTKATDPIPPLTNQDQPIEPIAEGTSNTSTTSPTLAEQPRKRKPRTCGPRCWACRLRATKCFRQGDQSCVPCMNAGLVCREAEESNKKLRDDCLSWKLKALSEGRLTTTVQYLKDLEK